MTIDKELQASLMEELEEYERVTKMTKSEKKALHEWVESGHSVHENASMAVHSGGYPIDFLDIYRDEEEIRQATKGMAPEEARKYAMAYYGWDDMPETSDPKPLDDIDFSKMSSDEIMDLIMGD